MGDWVDSVKSSAKQNMNKDAKSRVLKNGQHLDPKSGNILSKHKSQDVQVIGQNQRIQNNLGPKR